VGSFEVAFDDGQLWGGTVTNEAAKRAAATKMAERLAPGDVVGVGSGSTSHLTLQALVARARAESISWTAITTSLEMELACGGLGVPVGSLATLRPDWSFDGADEVDPAANLLKGRGGALLREKLVMAASKERYVVVDPSKLVDRLGVRGTVPIEVVPESLRLVRDRLVANGVDEVTVRRAETKDGPLVTERANLLLDVRVPEVTERTEAELKAIPGVVESGLFIGYRPSVIVAG
jgi:ribose 5-phosphate isomerase A